MAQSQLNAPWPGGAGGSVFWEPAGVVGEHPLDIWSQVPQTPVAQPSITVAPTPDRTDIAQVLSTWRAAERRLDEHIEASPMRSLIQSEIVRLRAEYQRLFALRSK